MSDAPVEYTVPRHPGIPSPSLAEVIADQPVGKDGRGPSFHDRVCLYRGGRVPPARSALVDRGRLLALGRGFVFVATSHHAAWREALAEVEQLAARGTAGAGLELALNEAKPAFGVAARSLRAVAVECFIDESTGQDFVKTRVGALAQRLASTTSCGLPYVDIVGVRCERAWSWGRFKPVRCCVLTLEPHGGETRTVCLTGPDAHLADAWLPQRFEQELLHVASEVWHEVLDARDLWQSLRGRYPDPSAVAVGRVWDDWQGALQARIASRQITPSRVVALALRRLEPWLEHYRRVPSGAAGVRAAEALAEGV